MTGRMKRWKIIRKKGKESNQRKGKRNKIERTRVQNENRYRKVGEV